METAAATLAINDALAWAIRAAQQIGPASQHKVFIPGSRIFPIRYDDLVTVTVVTERLSRTRVDHAYEIHGNSELRCLASTTLACVGRDGRPILMPDSLWGRAESGRQL